ncbi:MAG: SDR family NAD(P)-dependent oxidoreductase [Candidatus Humimicrobiia bacterium]
MSERVLITGGAGFIGSHLVDTLLEKGYFVRVYDNLEPQVHGKSQNIPDYFNKEAELIVGDVRDREKLKKAINNIDVVFHLAASVGVAQSMYEIAKYTESNTMGGATLLDLIANEKHNIRKVVVASSMSVYGEGAYSCNNCGKVYPKIRSLEQFKKNDWEMKCPNCNIDVMPIPTDEDKPLFPTSIYAVSKRDHEEMFLIIGRAYQIPTVALRFFNVYGPRQALSNPYTGVAAIFSSRLMNDKPPIIFEDGNQARDFIHVSDIVQACILAIEKSEGDYQVFNVGTGRKLSVLDVANVLMDKLSFKGEPQIVNRFREGDIRHCYADISLIKKILGYEPKVKFEDGIIDLVNWVKLQKAEDKVNFAIDILDKKGLTK